MTQALEVTRRCKVLEIGTGSGYQAAILARLARRVYTVERHRRLARRARELFQRLGLHNITVVHADGSLGLPEQAPFDRIIVTAAAEDPPQLADRPAPRRRHHGAAGRPEQRGADADPHRQDREAGSTTPTSAPCASFPLSKGWRRTYWIDARPQDTGRTAMREASASTDDRAGSARSCSPPRSGSPACGGVQNPLAGDDAPVEPAAQALPNLAPDSRGVITYATYQVAVARDGDTHGHGGEPGRHHARTSSPGATRCPTTTCCAPARCCCCPTA